MCLTRMAALYAASLSSRLRARGDICAAGARSENFEFTDWALSCHFALCQDAVATGLGLRARMQVAHTLFRRQSVCAGGRDFVARYAQRRQTFMEKALRPFTMSNRDQNQA